MSRLALLLHTHVSEYLHGTTSSPTPDVSAHPDLSHPYHIGHEHLCLRRYYSNG